MANKIILKRSSVTAKVPLTSDLEYGELALNYADGKLYYKDPQDAIQSIAGSGGGTASVAAWNKKSTTYTAVAGDKILADTTLGSFTISLPASPAIGTSVLIADIGNWDLASLTINRNNSTIEGTSQDVILDIAGIEVEFIYSGTTWQVFAFVGPKGEQGVQGPIGEQGIPGTHTRVYNFVGEISVGIGTSRWYPYAPVNIVGIYISCGKPPVNGSLSLNINKNGAFIQNIVLLPDAYRSSTITLTIPLTSTDYISVDVVSTYAAADAALTLMYVEA